jgi:hypothetical protein
MSKGIKAMSWLVFAASLFSEQNFTFNGEDAQIYD